MKDHTPVVYEPGDDRAKGQRRQHPAKNRQINKPVLIGGEQFLVYRRSPVAPVLGCSSCGDPMEPGSIALASPSGLSVVCSEDCARTLTER